MELTEATGAVLAATAILGIKMWLCGTVTTYVRGKVMESPNHEDGGVMNFFNRVFFVPTKPLRHLPGNHENDATTNRWLRICTNDAANIPIGLLALYLASAYGTLDGTLLVWMTWTFVAARLAHTATYALGLQPFRTMAYSVGATSFLVAAGSLVAA